MLPFCKKKKKPSVLHIFETLKYLVVPVLFILPVPLAARSKAWVCGRSPAEIVGSNPTGGHGCLSVANVVCCQVELNICGSVHHA